MAEIPQSWAVYGRLQNKVSTTTDIEHSAALEAALNIILEPDYSIEVATEADFLRAMATAGRQARHRALLHRRHQGELATTPSIASLDDEDHEDCDQWSGFSSLVDVIHARRAIEHVRSQLTGDEFGLLVDVAVGISYRELARQYGLPSGALRTRVSRLRHRLTCASQPRRIANDPLFR